MPTVAPIVVPTPATGALSGAVPVALRGTWQLDTGHWVFGADRASSWGDDISEHTLLAAGTSGDELSLGPRLDSPTACQKMGLYRWTLVSPTEFRLAAVHADPCPRGPSLAHADFRFLSSSVEPLDPPAGLPAACPLITSGEIAAIRGVDPKAWDPSDSSPSVPDCIWTLSTSNGLVVLDVTVERFDPAIWASQTARARMVHGPGWEGAVPPDRQGSLTLKANGFLVFLSLPPSGATSAGELERQATSVADLVVGRLPTLD